MRGQALLTLSTAAIAVLALACSDDGPTTLGTGTPPMGSGGTSNTGGNGTGAGNQGGDNTGASSSVGGSNQGGSPSFEVCATPPSSYPAAPYGHGVGDTFELVQMHGWHNDTPIAKINTNTYEAFTMEDIRNTHPNTFIMLHLAATF